MGLISRLAFMRTVLAISSPPISNLTNTLEIPFGSTLMSDTLLSFVFVFILIIHKYCFVFLLNTFIELGKHVDVKIAH